MHRNAAPCRHGHSDSVPDHRDRGRPPSKRGLPGDDSHPDGLFRLVLATRLGADVPMRRQASALCASRCKRIALRVVPCPGTAKASAPQTPGGAPSTGLWEARRRRTHRRACVAGGGRPGWGRLPSLAYGPNQVSWTEERGEKNTGGRKEAPGASQRPWRLPQRRLLGRVIAIIRRIPCGQGACGVTVPGSRCKSFVWPVLGWECVPALPLLTSQAPHKRPHPPMVHRESLARTARVQRQH
jgi:hypothetical protein